jgi:hypothetical protein
MAEWNSNELQTPKEFKQIQLNAQNAINNLDILLKLVKQGADVAKLFLLLANPAGAIIKIAANEIIKLCNDFKEIGVFYLFINPNDEGYGNQTSRELGLAIKQDWLTGLYQFKPTILSKGPGGESTFTVGTTYQRSLNIADLDPNYLDSNNRQYGDSKFIPPIPIYDDPPQYKLGGIDPSTWNGHAPVTTLPLADGTFPPEMKPSKVLQIMSESFDDAGDVSIFEVQAGMKNLARRSVIYTATGTEISKDNFDPDVAQSQRLFLDEVTDVEGTPHTMTERNEITDLISSGKPNFAGSSNLPGVEVIAIVALVGVESYQKFVDALFSLTGLFGGMPSLTEFYNDIKAISDKANAETGTAMTITNNTAFGTFEASTDDKSYYIVGQKSGAKAKILEIVKTEKLVMNRIVKRVETVDTAGEERGTGWFPSINTEKTAGQEVVIFSDLVDDNEDGNFKKMDIKVKMLPDTVKFIPEETIFEGVEVPVGPPNNSYNEIQIKPASGSATDGNKTPYDQVNIADVAKYGKVLGIDPTAPPSVHPDWTSIKIKDVIPGYGDFFDDIIQFAEGLKGYAAGADEFIARLIKLIDDTIKEFEETVNTIKAFLQLFVDGLPGAGVYWLTIKTYGGNKAIQAALTGSDNAPPDTLNFSAGFIMVSVSGMGGISATAGLEKMFSGMGLEFQEVAPIPEVSELDTAVLAFQDGYLAAKEAQIALATDVFDASGLNPPVEFRDAITITFKKWNDVIPVIGDYVLGDESGCFGQILSFGNGELVLDHIKKGPTVNIVQEPETRIVRMFDGEDNQVEFPYNGKGVDASTLAINLETAATNTAAGLTINEGVPLVFEGKFTEQVSVNRSSHTGNGPGATVYEMFQGNENTFARKDDKEEEIEELEREFTLAANQSWNLTGGDITIKQKIFKVINGAVKEPELTTGFNGRYGFFTDNEKIFSFGEELAQNFLADIEGRNTDFETVSFLGRLKPPPQADVDYPAGLDQDKMIIQIKDGLQGKIEVTGTGGEVESYAAALNNIKNPENIALETSQQAPSDFDPFT